MVKRDRGLRYWTVGLIAVLAVGVLVGCSGAQVAPGTSSAGDGETYTSEVLDATYDGALDVSGQLMLGTLRLEETGNRVTSEQAQTLLLLWQAIQGGTLQGDAEVNATLATIEGTMTKEQLAAIAAMRLTQDDVQAWMQEQGLGFRDAQGGPDDGSSGPPAGLPEGEVDPERVARQAEIENMSEEERAALRATMQASGGMPGGAGGEAVAGSGPATMLLEPLIRLLAQRVDEGAGRPAGAGAPLPAPTPTSTATPTPSPTDTVVPTVAPVITETVGETQVVTAAIASEPAQTEQANTAAPASEATPVSAETSAAAASVSAATTSVDLPRIPESGPRPPFTISVDAMRVADDGTIKVTGTVRNDGSETYEGVKVWATFYTQVMEDPDEKVRQGPPGKPGKGGQEQVQEESSGPAEEVLRPYGPVDVTCASPFLEPGAECPFSLEIYSRDYVAYHLGATGEPVEYRQPAAVTLSDVSVTRDAIGNVRFTGLAVNENGFVVQNPVVTGTLVDANGQIVSVASTRILGEIAPGGSEPFDLRVAYEPYATYQVYGQGTQG
jgi:hypothetical protein